MGGATVNCVLQSCRAVSLYHPRSLVSEDVFSAVAATRVCNALVRRLIPSSCEGWERQVGANEMDYSAWGNRLMKGENACFGGFFDIGRCLDSAQQLLRRRTQCTSVHVADTILMHRRSMSWTHA